jgi:hypothetical protein
MYKHMINDLMGLRIAPKVKQLQADGDLRGMRITPRVKKFYDEDSKS